MKVWCVEGNCRRVHVKPFVPWHFFVSIFQSIVFSSKATTCVTIARACAMRRCIRMELHGAIDSRCVCSARAIIRARGGALYASRCTLRDTHRPPRRVAQKFRATARMYIVYVYVRARILLYGYMWLAVSIKVASN